MPAALDAVITSRNSANTSNNVFFVPTSASAPCLPVFQGTASREPATVALSSDFTVDTSGGGVPNSSTPGAFGLSTAFFTNQAAAIAAGQVNSDWNATTGPAKIDNKPSLSPVATSGAYGDLSGRPTLGTAAARDVFIQELKNLDQD